MKKAVVLFFASLGALFLFSMRASAVPANSVAQTYTQPVGFTFTATPYGDEYLLYHVSEDGYVVVKDQDSYWYYATAVACEEKGVPADKILPSGFRYGLEPIPPNALRAEDLAECENLDYARTIEEQNAGVSTLTISEEPGTYLGNQRVLVIRVGFSDEPLRYSNAEWHDYMFSDGAKTVHTYYDETSRVKPNSQGKIQIVPAPISGRSQNASDAGVVSVNLSISHPKNPTFDSIQTILLQNVLEEIENQNLVDFGDYDKNGDGYINSYELHILFVLAGVNRDGVINSELDDSIHGHHTVFTQKPAIIDGVSLSPYSVVSERSANGLQKCELGTICHELGHDMGLPDLYDTEAKGSDHPNSVGIGHFGLMGSGCWGQADDNEIAGMTPTHLCAYSKIQLGIVEPITCDPLSTSSSRVTLYSFSDTNGYNVLKIPAEDQYEYFLMENRQSDGFDSGLGPNHPGGIAIFHVNNHYGENYSYGERLVDLEESSEITPGESILDSSGNIDENRRADVLYYAPKTIQFGPDTTPSNRTDADDTASQFNLSVLSPSGSAMQVEVETWLKPSALEEGLYRFSSYQDGMHYYMATQPTEYGPSFLSQNELTDNQITWFVSKRSSGEDAFNIISPYADPDRMLGYDPSKGYSLDYSKGVPAQFWQIYTFGGEKFLKTIDEENPHFVCIRDGQLTMTNEREKGLLSITKVNYPITAKEPGYNEIYGNLRISNAYKSEFLADNLYIQQLSEKYAPIWYVSKSVNGYCTISPADEPDVLLTFENGTVSLKTELGWGDTQLWSMGWVNGHLQIRPKSDLRRTLSFQNVTLSVPYVSGQTDMQDSYLNYTRAFEVEDGGEFYFSLLPDEGPRTALDAENFGLEDGTIVQGFSFNGASNQRWIVSNIYEDAYIIYPEYNPKLWLTMETGSQWVTLRESGGNDPYRYIYNWRIETEGRTCRISPYSNPDKCLRLDGGGRALVMPPAGDDYEWLATEVLVEDKLNTLPEGTYRLKNVKSSYYLHGYGSINGHAVYQYDGAYNNWNQQVWSWEKVEDSAGSANDYYILRSLYDPKVCLTYDESIGRCVLIPYTGGDNQKWRSIREVEDGTYGPYRFMLKSMPGHVMVVEGATTVLYEDIVIFGDNGTANGHWVLEATKPVQTIADGNYLFTNKNSGLVMDAENFKTDEGTRVLQWSSNSGENQLWIVKRETDGYYRISPSYAPNMYFSVGSDEKIRLTYDKDADEAKWLFLDGISYPSYYRLTPKSHPGMVSVVQYASKDEGAELILYADNGSSNGYWAPVEQPLQLTGNMYRIQNAATGLYLGAESSNGAAIGVGTTGGYSFDIWAVWSGGGFYRLSPYKYGSHLAVAADGRTVTLDSSAVSDPDAELWYFTQDGCIHSKKYPGKVLVLQDDASAVGTPVILAEQHTMDTETWIANAIG